MMARKPPRPALPKERSHFKPTPRVKAHAAEDTPVPRPTASGAYPGQWSGGTGDYPGKAETERRPPLAPGSREDGKGAHLFYDRDKYTGAARFGGPQVLTTE